jgi:transcription antitermination factor NusG
VQHDSNVDCAAVTDLDSFDERRWFAVQVWAGREQFTAGHLRQRGHEVFLPCYREHRQWSDRVKMIDRALFTGYVFCHLDAVGIGKVVMAPGVVRVVGDGRHPLSIPTDEIGTIQRIVDTRLMAEPWDCLQPGQRVRIEVGPLKGAEGVIVKVRNRHRLVVSIPLLQRSVAVDVQADWLAVPLIERLKESSPLDARRNVLTAARRN